MLRFLAKFYGVDRRWLYLATFLVLLLPLAPWWTIPYPASSASPPTQRAFEANNSCPADKVVLIDSSWDAGSASENRAEFETIIRHLCGRKTNFVITSIGVTPFGPEFAQKVAEPITKEAGYVYGVNWVNMGYIAGPPGVTRGGLGLIIEAMCRDFHARWPTDTFGTPIDKLPLLEKVRTFEDIHVFGCITYQPNDDWMSVISGMFGGKFWVGCMSIVGPYYYQYLDSGQITGMLAGNRGTAEYELLLEKPGRGMQLSLAGSFGNCAIIIGALLGNLGWWAARRVRRGGG